MIKQFYCYAYILNNIPIYVGKGTGLRYKIDRHEHSSHRYLCNKIKKEGRENIKITFLRSDISEIEALEWEKWYIWLYGRKKLGLGTLYNMTNGGDGNSDFGKANIHHNNGYEDQKV